MNIKTTLKQAALLLTGTLALASSALAQDILLEGVSIQQTVACHNNNLVINGASNSIRATGHCNRIEINGASVKVEADSVSHVRIVGASSSVLYKTSPNKNGKATVSISGASSYARKI
ncbi:DUF3060 domain-containing protein [Alkanindiges sp. WGS2144]|uniref:DUF3060 domain-containing protein n=1 Tax=Alkanindiges sp. WGS2144 TaxID=3366808 RepID=UPI00375182CF